jgi:magnesium chelatase family protein
MNLPIDIGLGHMVHIHQRDATHSAAGQGFGSPGAYAADTDHHCRVDDAGSALLAAAVERLGLSARALPRLLKLARTIADLGQSEAIAAGHVAEAIGYRRLAGVK